MVTGGAPEIRANLITQNVAVSPAYNYMDGSSASGGGGGIECDASDAMIIGNTISGNRCANPGGGVFASGGSPHIAGNQITGNSATGEYYQGYPLGGYGGGVYAISGLISDNLIVNNTAQTRGGGIRANGPVTVSNCTLVGNSAADGGGAAITGGAGLSNCIVAFNTPGMYFDNGATGVSHCDVFGNPTYDYSGTPNPTGTNGDISLDPLFANRSANDYHLAAGSPCINAGSDSLVAAGELDLDGRPRIIGAHVDIGAYEFGTPPFAVAELVSALRTAGGLAAATDMRLNVDGEAGITIRDAVYIARKVAGLDPNP